MKSILRTLSVTLISLLLVACGRENPRPPRKAADMCTPLRTAAR